MANIAPVMTKEFDDNKIRAIGTNERMGSKIFSFRVPNDVEEKLLRMSKEERVPFVRNLIVNAVRQ